MKSILVLASLALALGGCATVTRSDHTNWEVTTTPPGAKVRTTNGMFCDATPCSLTMKRKAEFTATVTKPGYKTIDIHITHKVSNAGGLGMAGNVVLGGLIGATVDVVSGAMMDLSPNPVHLDLERDEAVTAAAPAAVTPAAAVAEPCRTSGISSPTDASSVRPLC